jgi:electron transport complex protein RnfB
MGLVFGVVLAIAAQKFEVKEDEKVVAILEVLPGANCGGCGFPGCGGLASAIAANKAPVNGCPVGGAAVAEKVAQIMGVEVEAGERKVASVICAGNCDTAKTKYDYEGIEDCRVAAQLSQGPKSCKYGCLGLGTCKKACGFGAIEIVNGLAVINEDKCVNCGKCMEACPKHIIISKPVSKKVVVACHSNEFGKDVKSKCSAGCIGCGLCAKTCKFDAIKFENKLASIDFDKCIQCKACVKKCPTKVIKVLVDEATENKKLEETKSENEKVEGKNIEDKKIKKDAEPKNVKETEVKVDSAKINKTTDISSKKTDEIKLEQVTVNAVEPEEIEPEFIIVKEPEEE